MFLRSIRFFLIFYPVILLLVVAFEPNGRGFAAYAEMMLMLVLSTLVAEFLTRGKSVVQVSYLNYVLGICLSTLFVWSAATLAMGAIAYRASLGEIVFDTTLMFLISVAPVLALLRKRELQ